jgi:hypothetical protein
LREIEREREIERKRETDRETERHKDRERERERGSVRERERERDIRHLTPMRSILIFERLLLYVPAQGQRCSYKLVLFVTHIMA